MRGALRRSNLVPRTSQLYDGQTVLFYIMASRNNNVLYTGVTSNLPGRIFQHNEKVVPAFTGRYNVCKLVYYEVTSDVNSAIARGKQIKGGSRKKKIDLINDMNPGLEDLSEQF